MIDGVAMFLEIKDFLKPEEVARLRDLAAASPLWTGGFPIPTTRPRTTSRPAKPIRCYAESSRIVADAFARSARSAISPFPRHVAPPLLARYEVGMTYGAHADTSHMRFGNQVRRSDLSATVWLSTAAEL